MLAGLAHRHRATDQRSELRGAGQRFARAFALDRHGDAPRETLLPETGDHVSHFLERGPSKPVTDGFAALRIHAHVEWSVLLEAKTARRIVELWRGDAAVDEDAVVQGDLRIRRAQQRRQLAKGSMHKRKAPFRCEACATRLDGLAIAVDCDEASLRS